MKSKAIIALLIALSLPIDAQAKTFEVEPSAEVIRSAEKWGEEYDICPELILAICYNESRYTANAVNKETGCYGVMQIQKKSHKDRMKRLKVNDLNNIDQNIHVGADYLAELFEEYEDVSVVLGKYHGEPQAETKVSKYTKKVLKHSAQMERDNGK